MKKMLMILSVALLPAFAGFAHCGKCGVGHKKCPADCKKECCTAKKSCPEGCKKACCADKKECKSKKECKDKAGATKTEGHSHLQYTVKGMTCGGCSGKLTRKLDAIEGVSVDKVCHKGGIAAVTIEDKKATAADVEKAIVAAGFTVSN